MEQQKLNVSTKLRQTVSIQEGYCKNAKRIKAQAQREPTKAGAGFRDTKTKVKHPVLSISIVPVAGLGGRSCVSSALTSSNTLWLPLAISEISATGPCSALPVIAQHHHNHHPLQADSSPASPPPMCREDCQPHQSQTSRRLCCSHQASRIETPAHGNAFTRCAVPSCSSCLGLRTICEDGFELILRRVLESAEQ
eukprot:2687307-Amphidinium_carterae.1